MDHEQLRRVAATRPGYATYPNTRPGSPHWLRARQPGPCTWADRPGAGLLCVRADHQHGTPPAAMPAPVPAPVVDEPPAVTAVPAPPRRWWHRILTRADR